MGDKPAFAREPQETLSTPCASPLCYDAKMKSTAADTITSELRKLRTDTWSHKAERHYTHRNECRDIIAEFCAATIRKAADRLTRGFDQSIIERGGQLAKDLLSPSLEAAAESLTRAYLDTGTAADLADCMEPYPDGRFFISASYRKALLQYLRDHAVRRKSGRVPKKIDASAPIPFSLPHATPAVRRSSQTIRETTLRLNAGAHLLFVAGEANFTALIRRMGERWRNPKEREARAIAVSVDLLPTTEAQRKKNRVAFDAVESIRPAASNHSDRKIRAGERKAREKDRQTMLRESIKKRTKSLRKKFTRA